MDKRPQLLDLFSGAGGAAWGYYKAGFDVVGVDIKNQPHYPAFHNAEYSKHFKFIQADALEFPLEGYDTFHASPPCQHYSLACVAAHTTEKYPDLLPQTRERLKTTGKPWVIENVPNAPMRPCFILCGSQFGLPIVRHRLFEMWPEPFALVPSCNHVIAPIGIYGHGTNSWYRHKTGHNASTQDWRNAMQIQWMTKAELAEAIPPAYTEFIGKYLMQEVMRGVPLPKNTKHLLE